MGKISYLFVLFLAFSLSFLQNVAAQEKIIPDYKVKLTNEDKQNINYIITTLSGKTTIGLLLYKKKLEQAGENVDHVHPLRHLGYVFSNPDLASKSKNIGRVPWNRYVKGFDLPLHLAKKQGKMDHTVLEEFSNTVNINIQDLEPLVQKEDWNGFVNTLRDKT